MQRDIACSPPSTGDAVYMTKTTYAVDTGLYDALPADIRLQVYKAAFPEMIRPKRYDEFSFFYGPYVKIKGRIRCVFEHDGTLKPSSTYTKRDDFCTCSDCEAHRCDYLRNAIKNPFARDPAIRQEFLSHYLSLVQFHWHHTASEMSDHYLKRLPEFLDLMHSAGVVSALRHLSIRYKWQMGQGLYSKDLEFQIDAIRIAHIFAVLHKYQIKAELAFEEFRPCRKPFLGRVVELCKTHFEGRGQKYGEPFWEDQGPYGGNGIHQPIEEIFTKDTDLRKCWDEGK